jgi:ketosteroid isomerase-like protein
MTARPVLLLAAALAGAACAPSLLPGTEIAATRENREVYGVIRAYGEALQKKDAAAVMALVAPDYFDSAGTPTPEDDLDRAGLEKALPTELAKVDSFKLDLGIKRIEVTGDQAQAELYYDAYFRVVTPSSSVPRRESDLHLMKFRKIGADWKITSGI